MLSPNNLLKAWFKIVREWEESPQKQKESQVVSEQFLTKRCHASHLLYVFSCVYVVVSSLSTPQGYCSHLGTT